MAIPISACSTKEKTCAICDNVRVGLYCLNCERFVCWKHLADESYYQPGEYVCDPCARLAPFERRAIKRDFAKR